eukprot:scaffold22276_cov68-Phaeocystis_antarctica.AAC.2
MAFLLSANSMAMVTSRGPNLTCAASRTHTRRAQHARAASGPSRQPCRTPLPRPCAPTCNLTASRRRA